MAQVWAKFRFVDLEIWQDSIEVAERLFDLADGLEAKRLYRFAEQLRGSGLSMSNNIAEGSGSTSKREFLNFLNIARRSTFENANILLVLEKRGLFRGGRSYRDARPSRSLVPKDHKLSKKPTHLMLYAVDFALYALRFALGRSGLARSCEFH